MEIPGSRSRYVLNYFYFLVFLCLDEITKSLYGTVEDFSDERQSGGCQDKKKSNPSAEKKAGQEHYQRKIDLQATLKS